MEIKQDNKSSMHKKIKINEEVEEILKKIYEEKNIEKKNKIKHVILGDRIFEIKTDQFNKLKTDTKYFCNECLRMYEEKISYDRHRQKCDKKIPGLKLIYEEKQTKIYKIYGYENVPFCQNLCLLGKCFIDHKTLFWDIENYNFYILFDNSNFAGFFSEEKYNANNNLSCVVVLPDCQRKGFGSLLIDLSYFYKKGTCERPLSSDGEKVYYKYWKYKVYKYLEKNNCRNVSISDMANELNMANEDVFLALNLLKCKIDEKITCDENDLGEIRLVKKEYLK
ncbi:histone acetlytransferase [Vairimorpha necatrix]|uniref:Histone acetyltransferase n=1 Tax=Vairimorpha necatrix TaxID=6039 RepID=A0AAX4JEJ3_9MICR